MNKSNIPLFLAHRLLFSKNYSYSIKIVSWVCFSTIAISSFALTLIIAIMQGFETATEERLQSIHPQIIIQSLNNDYLDFIKIKKYLKNNFPEILAISPNTSKHGTIHNPQLSNNIELDNIVLIKGVNPKTENSISKLESKIKNKKSLQQVLDKGKVLIGEGCAESLYLDIDDPIAIFVPTKISTNNKKVSFDQIDTFVGGVFKTGISEFDNDLIITSLDFIAENFNESGVSEIGITLKNNYNEKNVIKNLNDRLKLNVFSWKEPYSTIVSALKLEKYAAVLIAILIIIIASMTLISLLFMLITQHTSTIAILTVLGLSIKKIRLTFTLVSLLITTSACLLGTLLATIAGVVLQNYHFIELPDVYYVSTLPIKLSPTIFFGVIVVNFIITLITTQIPLRLIDKLNVSQILKTNN